MRFSLVVATLNRTREVHRLLASLERQRHRDFEVIVVDQNTDGRLSPILDEFANRLEIRRFVSGPGLSRARNFGLRSVTGEVVCFPDDDCWYTENVLADVNRLLIENSRWDGIVGHSVDESGRATLPWSDRTGKLTMPKCWRRSISYAIFVRTAVIGQIGGFDPTLGVGSGSLWGSGEDNDFVLRALKAGFHFRYERGLRIIHPKMFLSFDEACCEKRYRYALGDGKLLRKHPMPLWWRLLFFTVPLFRASASSLRLSGRRTYFHWLTFNGRLKGFLASESAEDNGKPLPAEVEPLRDHVSPLPLKARSATSGTE